MHLLVPAEFLRPAFCPFNGIVQFVGEFVAPLPHLVGIALPPFQLVDVEEVEVRECRDEQFEPGQCRDLDTDIESHCFRVPCGGDEIRFEDLLPAFMRGVKTDLVHEPLHLCQFLISRGLCRIEVDLVFRAEMVL